MNFNLLMDILLLEKQRSFPDNFDPFSEMKSFLDSPLLCNHVLDTLKERILPTIEEIHKDHVYIKVEVDDRNIGIYVNNTLVLDNNSIFSFPDEFRFITEKNIKDATPKCITEYAEDRNVILNFHAPKTSTIFTKDCLDGISVFITELRSKEVAVREIEEEDMFRLKRNNNYLQVFQYFYKKDNKCYCAFIKSYNHRVLNSFYDLPSLYYFVKSLPYKIEEGYIETLKSLSSSTNRFIKGDEYILYVVKKTNDLLNSGSFFENFFTKIGYNNFFKCYVFLYENSPNFVQFCKSYCERFNSSNKPFFYRRLTEIADESKSFLCEKTGRSYYILRSFSIEQIRKSEISVDKFENELQLFFSYLYEEHNEYILSFETKFLEIMDSKILKEVKSLFIKFKRKANFIINLFNLEKQESLNNFYRFELNKKLKEILSEEEINLIYQSSRSY